jgi:hypothetical protein
VMRPRRASPDRTQVTYEVLCQGLEGVLPRS